MDPVKELRAAQLELGDEHRGDPVEAKQNYVPTFLLEHVVLLLGCCACLQGRLAAVGQNALREARHHADDLLAMVDGVAVQERHDGKGPDYNCHGVLCHVPEAATFIDSHAADHNGKLADLRQVDGGKRSLAGLPAKGDDEHEDANPPDDRDKRHHEHRLAHDIHGRERHLHANARKEQRDEEVSNILDLAVEVLTIGESGEGATRNDRGELHRQANEGQDRHAADEEAPREGQHEH
mmetsp:Transcript_10931/g.24889  ORF Transcript_10931/g.24889 Transcript_10931/m.24889 type:complete len:237 (+) Transcript_10931:572-1282(+)